MGEPATDSALPKLVDVIELSLILSMTSAVPEPEPLTTVLKDESALMVPILISPPSPLEFTTVPA